MYSLLIQGSRNGKWHHQERRASQRNRATLAECEFQPEAAQEAARERRQLGRRHFQGTAQAGEAVVEANLVQNGLDTGNYIRIFCILWNKNSKQIKYQYSGNHV